MKGRFGSKTRRQRGNDEAKALEDGPAGMFETRSRLMNLLTFDRIVSIVTRTGALAPQASYSRYTFANRTSRFGFLGGRWRFPWIAVFRMQF